MRFDRGKIRIAIEGALAEVGQSGIAADAAFHMTDWLDDLEAWLDLCENPEAYSPDQINKLLVRFLVHVPDHVAAAGKLITGIAVKDTFEVGAVEGRSE